ncbi:MAG: cation-translocating P-type ATPase [Gemmataceae bacterium]
MPAHACDFCGLPVAPPLFGAASDEGPQFCCYGCRFASQVSGASGEQGEARWMLTRLGLAGFFAMNVMAFTMVLWTQDVYGESQATAGSATLLGMFRYLCLLFTLPVVWLLGGPLWTNSCDDLRQGRFSTDFLLLIGVAAACLYSLRSVMRDAGPVYFEVACAVLVFVTLGRWLEARGKLQATQALDALQKLLPETVRSLGTHGDVEKPLNDVSVGERLRVRAGERIPCDGIVRQFAAHVDEQILTGESAARTKEPGDEVYAGTLNLDSDLILEVKAAPNDGTIARLLDMMRRARQSKGRYERLANRLSRVFVPVVVLIACGAAIWHGIAEGWDHGILSGLAVLLIACPCALGIATPMAVWAALGTAAKRGVLFRSGDVLERLAAIRQIAFDKTGTLTLGQSRLAEVIGDHKVLTLAAKIASASTHVHSRALTDAAHHADERIEKVATLAGRGLHAKLSDGRDAYLGSLRLMTEQGQQFPTDLRIAADRATTEARPLVALAVEGEVRAVFLLEEQLRPHVADAMADLRERGVLPHILTGDHQRRGEELGRQLGVEVRAELLPEDKWTALAQLRQQGGTIAMVGDGINDGPALTASDVGIAMGCGADVARASAGVCLLGDDLTLLPWSMDLARRTVKIVRQNLFWAFAYNVIGIGMAVVGWLNPVWAAIFMTVSSLMVIANSLRLAPRKESTPTEETPLAASVREATS